MFQPSFRNVRGGGIEGVARNDKAEPGGSEHTWTRHEGLAYIGKHNEHGPLISQPDGSIRYLEQDVQSWTVLIELCNTLAVITKRREVRSTVTRLYWLSLRAFAPTHAAARKILHRLIRSSVLVSRSHRGTLLGSN